MADEFEELSSFNPEQLWSLVRRERWWILLPLFLCWFAAWTVSWLIPATYQSEALILIEQQKVPEQYVVANVSVSLDERLQSMTQQVLSRTRLQKIIDRYQLYPVPKGLMRILQPGDPVDAMRKDIKIDLVEPEEKGARPEGPTAFKISYAAASPELAQQVNNMLTEQFIEESLNAQREMSESTTEFLEKQLKDAAVNLDEQEQNVRRFKAEHLGDLPSQLQSNVEILSGLQAQLQNVQHALDSANQQKLYLQSQLQQLQMVQGALGEEGGVSQLELLEKQLLEMRDDLAHERSRHTENYPDIVALKSKIAESEKLIKDLQRGTGNQTGDGSTAAPDGVTALPSSPLMQIRSQLKANDAEIRDDQRQVKLIGGKIADYQARLNLTPKTEQELAEVSRGYEESKANYNALLQKSDQSKLATSLEQREGGEQFRILDPPTLPDKPEKPIHLLLSLGGLAMGGFVGVILLALREVMNGSVRHEDDIDGVVPGRVLVRIPHLDTPHDIRLRAASRMLEWAAVVFMAVLIVMGNLYTFYKG